MQQTLSLVSGILFVLGFFPYILGILKKTAVPSKASWIIWAALDVITIYSMWLENCINGQIVGAVIGAMIVAILSLSYGKSGWTTLDKVCICGAIAGIAIMMFNPQAALLVSLFTMILGALPTFSDAWCTPEKMGKAAWIVWLFSCWCAMCSIPHWTIEDAAQPITFLFNNSVMIYLVFVRPHLGKSTRT